MKTSKYQVLKTIALCVVLLAAARTGKAQVLSLIHIYDLTRHRTLREFADAAAFFDQLFEFHLFLYFVFSASLLQK